MIESGLNYYVARIRKAARENGLKLVSTAYVHLRDPNLRVRQLRSTHCIKLYGYRLMLLS